MPSHHVPPHAPIAIVGVSALFPGSSDAGGFWRDILAGRDLLTDVPATHWHVADYYDPDPAAPDKTYAKRGGFLSPVDFDALAWGVPPATLPATDTSQLLALILAQAVLKDALGDQFEQADRSRVSVILGVTSAQELLFSMVSRLQRPVWERALRDSGLAEAQVQDACARIAAQYVPWQEASFPGLLGNVVAGRIANRLNLGGTNCVTDAACASSFSAVAMAVAELQLGHSDLVISGGVDTLNDIFMYLCFSKTPALSPSGDCRPFSDQADGTMLGEGIGMVALKRLADAERDGDRIYALLAGVGSASDGRSKSVYAPVSAGQALALNRAYAQAGFGAESVELVEAHGTGTRAGDAAEFEGLCQVYDQADSQRRGWCALGSVKSQIGHTKAAAGAAGLFKAVMALHHGVLPPTIKVDAPNPKLQIERSAFYLNTRARPWIRGSAHPRRAAVSAFGFGGSNFHLALEEYRGANGAQRLPTQSCELLLLHADSSSALLAQARDWLQSELPLANLAHASRQQWNAAAPHRLALVAASREALHTRLRAAIERIGAQPELAYALPDGSSYGVGAHSGKLALLFPGQGSQYLHMGDALAMQFADARAVWDRAADVPMDALQALHEVVYPRPGFGEAAAAAQRALLTATEWAQPALAAHSAALLALLRAFGVRADMFAGHSFGELMALHAAEVFDLDSTLRLARRRGEAMRDAAQHPGGMLVLSEPVERVREWIGTQPIVIANHNAPRQVVVSGAVDAIATFAAQLAQAGVRSQALAVASAFHSPIVASASVDLAAALATTDLRAPALPVYANSSATVYPDTPAAMAAQLAAQLAQPVRFVEMIEAMYADGARTFVEVGPGNVLSGLTSAILGERPHRAIALDRKQQDGVESLLIGLARLAAAGVSLNPAALYADTRLPPPPSARAKHAIAICGSNLGKPYPGPLPGARVTPAPEVAPAARVLAAAQPVAAAPPATAVLPTPGNSTQAPIVAPAASAGSHPAIIHPRSAAMSSHPQIPDAWLNAFQESQAQSAAAHEAFQRAMADSHTAYLKLSETALGGLSALLLQQASGGTGATAAALENSASAARVPVESRQLHVTTAGEPRTEPVVVAAKQTPRAPASAARAEPAPVAPRLPAAAAAATNPTAPPAIDLPALLLAIVADKTGYPVDMLNLQMDLEGDLGIDSIKRVEILAAVDERTPELPEVDRAQLSSLRTLAEIVAYLGATAGAATDTKATRPAPVVAKPHSTTDLPALLLAIVADKTGYPVDMLNLQMDLEGDLGIDSIKRVEILAAVDERAPELPKVDRAQLSSLRTLAEIVSYLGGDSASSLGAAVSAEPVAAIASKRLDSTADTHAATPPLQRYELDLIDAPASGLAMAGLYTEHTLYLVGAADVATALAAELHQRGVRAQAVRDLPAGATACVYLGALADFADEATASAVNFAAFALARQLAPTLERAGGLYVTVQDTGGAFGLEAMPALRAWGSGLPALIKTCALEWPQAALKAIDLERGGRDAPALARAIADELLQGGGEIEVALRSDGSRRTLCSVARAVQPQHPVIEAGDVVVVSGGARGVTAACLRAWAARSQPCLVLLGRTELTEEPGVCAGIADDAGLKRVLLAAAQAAGEALTPAALQARVNQVQSAREIRVTLASLRAAGSAAHYRAVAVEDAHALATVLAEVRSNIGPIRGLVHAAGVLADKRIAEKTDAQFDAVYATKVGGLRALLDATCADPLKLLAVFSSVSARCGNTGQADYAMANEVLAKVAAAEQRARPGLRVKSLGWGPWEGGMVSPQLRTRFAELGVPMIPLAHGAVMFADEMADDGALELVLGGEPRPEALLSVGNAARVESLELKLDRSSHGWLLGHSVAGLPVVPVVLIAEWLARAVRSWRPGLHLQALHDLKVLKGIRLRGFENGGDRLRFEASSIDAGQSLQLHVRGAQGELHYSARATLGRLPSTGAHGMPAIELADWQGAPLYQDLLFHRGQFELIERIEGISDAGIAADLRGVSDAKWPGSHWQIDAAALDGGLQIAVLYAQRMLGANNLPTSIGELRSHAPPSAGPMRACAYSRRVSASAVTTDIVFTDPSGRRLAELLDVQTHAISV